MSQDRLRHEEGSVNIDLTYVTDRVLGMLYIYIYIYISLVEYRCEYVYFVVPLLFSSASAYTEQLHHHIIMFYILFCLS